MSSDNDLAGRVWRGSGRSATFTGPWSPEHRSVRPSTNTSSMAVMAWFKKERKPRASKRERLEIPADAWEKCENCGHIDIREKFERALQRLPGVRPAPADLGARSTSRSSPMRAPGTSCTPTFAPPTRCSSSTTPIVWPPPAGRRAMPTPCIPARASSTGCRSISASWTSPSWAARWARWWARRSPGWRGARLDKKVPLVLVSRVGRRADAGGRALAHADGQDLGGHRRSCAEAGIPYISILTDPDDRRRVRVATRCRAT